MTTPGSEIDAAPAQLPVTVAGRLRVGGAAGLAADDGSGLVGQRRARRGGVRGRKSRFERVFVRNRHEVKCARIVQHGPQSTMTDHPTDAAASCLLDDYATLRFKGADAGKFLQGQLSNDLDRLRPGHILRAGLHNPQGRTLALLWLAMSADGDILALLPKELAGSVATQLKRYLLRARLAITDESAQHQVRGHWQPALSLPSALPAGWWHLDAGRAIS